MFYTYTSRVPQMHTEVWYKASATHLYILEIKQQIVLIIGILQQPLWTA